MRTMWLIVVAVALSGCGGDSFEQAGSDPGGSAGSAVGGTGGSAGFAGSDSGGSAGSATGGAGGIAGSAGSGGGGVGGSAGSEQGGSGGGETGGSAGAQGGSAGSAGSAGATGGSAGQAGGGGAAGQAGSAGADPEGTVLASDLDEPTDVTVDATAVFWVNDWGLLQSTPLGGGSVSTLLDDSYYRARLVVEDGDSLYYATGNRMWQMRKNGTDITEITTSQVPLALTQNSTHLVWGGGGNKVWRALKSDLTQIAPPITTGGDVTSLAATDDFLYWAGTNSPWVYGRDLVADQGTVVYYDAVQPGPLCADDMWVYVVDYNGSFDAVERACQGAVATIHAVQQGSFGNTKVVASNQACPTDLACEGTTLYWANNGSFDGAVYQDDGAIMRYHGANPEVVAPNQQRPERLALGEGVVVWTNRGTIPGKGTVKMIDR